MTPAKGKNDDISNGPTTQESAGEEETGRCDICEQKAASIGALPSHSGIVDTASFRRKRRLEMVKNKTVASDPMESDDDIETSRSLKIFKFVLQNEQKVGTNDVDVKYDNLEDYGLFDQDQMRMEDLEAASTQHFKVNWSPIFQNQSCAQQKFGFEDQRLFGHSESFVGNSTDSTSRDMGIGAKTEIEGISSTQQYLKWEHILNNQDLETGDRALNDHTLDSCNQNRNKPDEVPYGSNRQDSPCQSDFYSPNAFQVDLYEKSDSTTDTSSLFDAQFGGFAYNGFSSDSEPHKQFEGDEVQENNKNKRIKKSRKTSIRYNRSSNLGNLAYP